MTDDLARIRMAQVMAREEAALSGASLGEIQMAGVHAAEQLVTERAEVAWCLDAYDAGLLGGANGCSVDWWHDYIRAELGRAHEHYQVQVDALRAARGQG